MANAYDAAISYDDASLYDGIPAGTAVYKVSVDWNNDGDYSDSNEDITADVLQLTTQQGRSLASQITGKAVAGTLEAILINSAGKYSSFNTSSPLAGNILPNRRVKVETLTPTESTIFLGYLERITPIVDAQGVTKARLVALGSL